MNQILYKPSKSGDKVQYWEIILDGDKYKTVEGYKGGALTESAWTYGEPKNIGKANETTGETQAHAEYLSKIQKKKDKGYKENIEEIERPFGVTLAKEWTKYKDKVQYPVIVQGKLDGCRNYIKNGQLFYRSNKPVLSCPHLSVQCEYVIDGELYNHELRNDFNKIVSLIRRDSPSEETAEKVKFYIFDIIVDLPYEERQKIISEIVKTNSNFIQVESFTANNESEVEAYLDKFLKEGYEGAMIRWGNDGYIQERTNKLLKYKSFRDSEYKIVEVLDGKGKRSGTVAKWVLALPDGRTFECGPTGTDEQNKQFWLDKDSLVGKLATVKYQELTPDGIPRFGVFKSVREDI